MFLVYIFREDECGGGGAVNPIPGQAGRQLGMHPLHVGRTAAVHAQYHDSDGPGGVSRHREGHQ